MSRKRAGSFVMGTIALGALLLASMPASAADLSQAVVKQRVNVVTVASSLKAKPEPAREGAVVRDENVVRTGNESRAELEFSDLTLARMGGNSIFSFDASNRALDCERGTVLFSKPTNSGRVEVRAGAITAAITGSTGFVSHQPTVKLQNKQQHTVAESRERTAMIGMLEGKLRGDVTWRDKQGKGHSMHFTLGPGEMLVAQPGVRPVLAQFDIPRFVRSSPLIKGFKAPLHNQALLDKAIADYQADERRGFVLNRTLVSNQPQQLAWLARTTTVGGSFDAGVDQLRNNILSGNLPTDGGGFVDVGGTGILRGQLTWTSLADLDLHLVTPDNQEVFYANTTVTLNNGSATAKLDVDNLGGVINVQPNVRVENIVVTGVPSAGTYTFFVRGFASLNPSDTYTLRVSYANNVQTSTGSVSPGQNSPPINVQVPRP